MEDFEARRQRLVKESGPTGRTVAVLDFLALNSESEYTFAELARQTGISKATLHDIVRVLVENAYMRRSTNGRLSLGPAIIGLGDAAIGSRLALLNLSRPLLSQLAASEGLQAVASTVTDDEIVILARHGDRLVRSPWYEVGERIPFAPPIGTVFLAWGDEAELQRWFEKSDDTPSDLDHDEIRSAVRAARERGYTFGLRVNARERLQLVLHRLEDEETVDGAKAHVGELLAEMKDERYLVAELNESSAYDVDFISSPVFDSVGRVSMAVNVVGFTRPQSKMQIERLGRLLLSVAMRITAASGGVAPDSFPFEIRSNSRTR
ncbi:helix-turn-helix domain-containing protein [Microbacterium sp. LWH7-1.2]|uniref:IclR family transcriptional regulator n=1 Tax=Microbacterium sp. LWH7-1.2 TaxID=3135257 RepID=UPI003138AD3A